MRPVASAPSQALILADDFPCNQTGPISDIHIWASWLGDTATANVPDIPITLGIWSDVPASTNADGFPVPSHPGRLLWSQAFLPGGALPGHYQIQPWPPMPVTTQQFWSPDPPPSGAILGVDHVVWQYNFFPDAANIFTQQGSPTVTVMYWLSVTAGNVTQPFGWMTSVTNAYDTAVYGHLDSTGTPLNDWKELVSPATPGTAGRNLGLSFALTTTNQPTPPPPPPTNPSKWAQYPDLANGLNINAASTDQTLILADDFPCMVAAPITNIQLWGSWLDNVTPAGGTFEVSIWSDAPRAAGAVFSQPLQRLWHQTYAPGTYTFSFYGVGTEHFYNEQTGLLSPETNVWLYSFDIPAANAFCQQGPGHTYWVAVAVLPPPVAFLQWGWKTSTNHWGDAAVYGKVDPASGLPLGPWQPLLNPLATPLAPLDFAFLINGGPPSPDCDPNSTAGDIQWPDTSANGLDVFAVSLTQVGDDFLCQNTGPISGFTVWGSWLNDVVDTNALFNLSFWSDIPALPGASPFSRPGTLLCTTTFSPPQTIGTSVQRYRSSLYASNLTESFYNPNPPAGVIGADTQIWRYDFFPFVPSCFFQRGSPFNGGITYWVTLQYIHGNPNDPKTYDFGWKTSTNHWGDAAVFAPTTSAWQPLMFPAGSSLDLSRIVWKFPVIGINKDMVNLTGQAADGIQLVLKGPHLITWHYDGAPPWNSFLATNDAAGNTVLTWSGGPPVAAGATNHIGFETPGTVLPTILSMNWLLGTTIIGPALQVNFHFLGTQTLINNNFFPEPVLATNLTLEIYSTPPGLDQLTPTGQRSPMMVMPMAGPQNPLNPGDWAAVAGAPTLPPGAQYAVFIVPLRNADGLLGATDFILLPLDTALAPELTSVGVDGGGGGGGGNITLHIGSLVGRSYQLQSIGAIGGARHLGQRRQSRHGYWRRHHVHRPRRRRPKLLPRRPRALACKVGTPGPRRRTGLQGRALSPPRAPKPWRRPMSAASDLRSSLHSAFRRALRPSADL